MKNKHHCVGVNKDPHTQHTAATGQHTRSKHKAFLHCRFLFSIFFFCTRAAPEHYPSNRAIKSRGARDQRTSDGGWRVAESPLKRADPTRVIGDSIWELREEDDERELVPEAAAGAEVPEHDLRRQIG